MDGATHMLLFHVSSRRGALARAQSAFSSYERFIITRNYAHSVHDEAIRGTRSTTTDVRRPSMCRVCLWVKFSPVCAAVCVFGVTVLQRKTCSTRAQYLTAVSGLAC